MRIAELLAAALQRSAHALVALAALLPLLLITIGFLLPMVFQLFRKDGVGRILPLVRQLQSWTGTILRGTHHDQQ